MKAHWLAWLAWLALGMVGNAWCAEAAPAPGCAVAASETVLAQVSKRLKTQWATPDLELQLTPMTELPDMPHPQIKIQSQGLRSRVPVAFTGTLCGHDRPSTVTVWLKVQAWSQAWVYGRAGRADQALADLQLHRGPVDLAGTQLRLDDLPGDVTGAWLSQSVNAGIPVLKRHLKAEPLVLRDTPVTVVVYGPGLMLRTQGKALRAGVLGERVPVLMSGAESSLLAVVAGKGEVHVER